MLKNIKIIVPILFFVFSFQIASADTCDQLKPVLDKYYQASQAEDLDAYMGVMDVDYLRENLLDNYEDYVRSAWEVYDTKNYKFKMYNCRIDGDGALAYFNLKSTIESDGQEIETQRNYVAWMHNINGWKIKYVMDEDIFSQFQNGLYTELFLDATRDELVKSLDDADAFLEYTKMEEKLLSENLDNTVSEGVQKKEVKRKINYDYEEGSSWRSKFVIAFFILPIGIYFFVQRRNKK